MFAYAILIPQMLISLISWIQLILSMNRYRGVCMFKRTDLWGLLLFIHGGFVRWIATLAIRVSSLPFQVFTAMVGATMSWTSFVIVFNEGFRLPSRQQIWALIMSLIVTSLWEVNNRMIVILPTNGDPNELL